MCVKRKALKIKEIERNYHSKIYLKTCFFKRRLKVEISLAFLTNVGNEFQSFAAKNENDLWRHSRLKLGNVKGPQSTSRLFSIIYVLRSTVCSLQSAVYSLQAAVCSLQMSDIGLTDLSSVSGASYIIDIPHCHVFFALAISIYESPGNLRIA